jgi:hypothetical protein
LRIFDGGKHSKLSSDEGEALILPNIFSDTVNRVGSVRVPEEKSEEFK